VLGRDGVGKTWATLDWLVARRPALPIVLVAPSAAAAGLAATTPVAIREFMAERLHDLARTTR
jgi:hypothetical protein